MDKVFSKPQNMTALAHRIAELGYHPVPIQPGSKGPRFPKWEQYEATPEAINRDFPPQGIVIGIKHDNLGAVDIDVYCPELAAKLRDEWISRFPNTLERVGQAPKTAFVFRLPDNPYTIRNTDKAKKGDLEAQVEVRTKSGQIVAYGLHPKTGKPYHWPGKQLWETPISDLRMIGEWEVQEYRDWADQQIKEWAGVDDRQEPLLTRQEPTFKIDLGSYAGLNDGPPKEEAVKEALSYIPADLSHDDWVQVLMALHDYYNGSTAGLYVAQDWSSSYAGYNAREVEAKWRSFKGSGVSYSTIFHYAREYGADLSEIGRKHRTDAQRAREPIPDPQPVTPTTIQDFPIDSSEAFLADLKPLEYLIDGLLPTGVTYSLTGYAGHGKTTLALQFALSVATGEMFSDRDTSQGSVLVLAGENPHNVKWQYAAALAARDLKPADVPIYFVQGRFSIKEWTDVLRAKLAAMPDLKLIIVDSLQAFFEGDNDNDNTQMVEMAHKMRRLCDIPQRPAQIIIAHPAGKTPQKDNLVPRGGGAFLNEIDGNLTVWSQDASSQTLHHSQKFRGAGFDPMEWVMEVRQFDHLTDVHGTPLKLPVSRPETVSERSSREAVNDHVLRDYLLTVEAGQPVSVREGAARFMISRWRMDQIVKTAKDEKLIKRYAKTYVLTDGGRDYLEAQNAGE